MATLIRAKRRPLILFDADNVLYEWEAQYIEDCLALDPNYPVIPLGQRTEMDVIAKGTPTSDISYRVKNRPGFYLDLKLNDYAQEALAEIEDAGADVMICTAPSLDNPTCASDKHAAITRDFGRARAKRTIITSDKTVVMGDALVDDKAQITGLMTPQWEHVVYDRSYNRHVANRRMMDLRHWRDALGHLLEHEFVA